jgi:hypothetical protein
MSIKITFVGDIALYKMSNDFTFSEKIKVIFDNSNLCVANLEAPVTDSEDKLGGQVLNLKADVRQLSLIKNFSIISLANNHVLDYKDKGLTDTFKNLQTSNIAFFGAGKTKKEAKKPLSVEISGLKIAFIGATRYANATQKTSGTCKDVLSWLKPTINQLKQDGYFTIIYFHWGYEYVRYPSPRERRLAHRCIDLGADFIVGSHPHIFQGKEVYKGKQIYYSLGNFLFHNSVGKLLSPYGENDTRLHESFVVILNISDDFSYSVDEFYYSFDNLKMDLMDNVEAKGIQTELEEISSVLHGNYKEYFKKYFLQTKAISQQNVKMRKNFQKIEQKSFREKIIIYSQANWQDLLNRVVALFL